MYVCNPWMPLVHTIGLSGDLGHKRSAAKESWHQQTLESHVETNPIDQTVSFAGMKPYLYICRCPIDLQLIFHVTVVPGFSVMLNKNRYSSTT